MNKPEYLIVHHTGGTDADKLADTSHHTFEMVDEWHRKLWNFKSSLGHFIGYHYFIDKTGKVTQGRVDTETGAHTIGKNNSSIGICLAGNFDVTDPSDAQVAALKKLLKRLAELHNIPSANIVPHRAISTGKTCYGKRIADNWAAELIDDDKPDAPSHMMIQDLKKAHELAKQAIALLSKYV